jgi:hypothetical protein
VEKDGFAYDAPDAVLTFERDAHRRVGAVRLAIFGSATLSAWKEHESVAH